MGKKKKKKKVEQPVDPQKQRDAIRRLAALFAWASRPPETVVGLLERLSISYAKGTVSDFNIDVEDGREYMLIALDDLDAGEQRNQEMGSVMNRIEKGNTDELPL